MQDEEDLCAVACAAYVLLLAAHGRGLAGYWRTPGVLRTDAGREACGVGAGERVVGLLHLGALRQPAKVKDRSPVESFTSYLD